MIVLFVLILGLFVLFILAPFFTEAFRNKRLPDETGEVENLNYRRDEVLSAIEDLKYDYQMNKIAEADYLQMNEKLSQEAVEVSKRIDQTKGANTRAKADRSGRTAERNGS